MMTALTALAFSSDSSNDATRVRYKTQRVDALNIFYREAGSPSQPTIVLLHGFPSSSHMYRDLIPKLAVNCHVIAADMPGFGYSDQPTVEEFDYTFDHLANVMDHFLDSIGLTRYSIYIQDYGSPVGFRLFSKVSGADSGHHQPKRQRLRRGLEPVLGRIDRALLEGEEPGDGKEDPRFAHSRPRSSSTLRGSAIPRTLVPTVTPLIR